METSDGMQQYVEQLLGQSSKLRGIGFDISEDWMVAILLAGLTDDFKPFITGLKATNMDMSSEMVISKLLDNQQNSNNVEPLLSKKTKPRRRNKGAKESRKGCFNCGSLSHFYKDCTQSLRNNASQTTTKQRC